MRNRNVEVKEHYKAYKVGKKWVFAGILVATGIFGGISIQGLNEGVKADVNSSVLVASSTASSSAASSSAASSSAASSSTASSSTVSSSTASSSAASSSTVSSSTVSSSTASSSAVSSSTASSSTASSSTAGSSMASSSAAQPVAQNGLTTPKNRGTNTGVSDDTFTLTYNAKAGDKVVINIPSATTYYDVTVASGSGVTFTKTGNADSGFTITDLFSIDGTFQQTMTLLGNSNYRGHDTVSDGGITEKEIKWSINGVDQESVKFQQTIIPKLYPSAITRWVPGNSKDKNAVTRIVPDTDYVYQFSANEANGVYDDINYQTAQVHAANNYGGTVFTIPVPAGFVLNQEETDLLNNFQGNSHLSGTTITQVGGMGTAITINVPATRGNTSTIDSQPYLFVGHFTQSAANVDQVVTADGVVSVVQVIDAAGDQVTATAQTPWTEKIAAKDVQEGVIKIIDAGNKLVNPTLKYPVLIQGQDDIASEVLGRFGFVNLSAYNLKDLTFNMNFADGLRSTGVLIPASLAIPSVNRVDLLHSINSWQYTIVYQDNTTQSGIALPGTLIGAKDIVNSKVIRQVILKPDVVNAGARTSSNYDYATGDYTIPADDTTSFIVYGALATQYDDGITPVKAGDKLTMSMSATSPTISSTVIFSNQVTQLVTKTLTAAASIVGGGIDFSTEPGKTGGVMWLQYPGINAADTTTSIFEPVVYYVLPANTTYGGSYSSGILGNPQISFSKSNDGREVVKIDYTGTGFSLQSNATTTQIMYNNLNNVGVTNSTGLVFISAPTTTINSAHSKPTDLSLVAGDANAVLIGSVSHAIVPVNGFTSTQTAVGNMDSTPLINANMDKNGSKEVTIYSTIQNVTGNPVGSIDEYINLPQKGDVSGSQFTVEITGPITVPEKISGAKVLYTTQVQNLTEKEPDITAYQDADQITDWSKVQSILVQIPQVAANDNVTLTIEGMVSNLIADGSKIAYVQTGSYSSQYAPIVNNTPDTMVSISVTGTSTVQARFHYVDSNGIDQYILIPDLAQTLVDGKDIFKNIYPTSQDQLSDTDKALIPVGYEMVPDQLNIVTAGSAKFDGMPDGMSKFGQISQYYSNNDVVQFELVASSNDVN